MLDGVDYPYAHGDLLECPNTYFYSSFYGKAFVSAWLHSREECLHICRETGGAEQRPSDARPTGTAHFLRRISLKLQSGALTTDDKVALNSLLRNFEAKKRIFEDYESGFRSAGRTDFKDLSLYVDFAEVLAGVYAVNQRPQYLNALIKCLDILCAYLADLTDWNRERLGRLITDERKYVIQVAAALDLELEAGI